MQTYLIPNTDLVVSRIAYGCAGLAGWSREPATAGDVASAARVVMTACDNGITLFDHADIYGYGRAETFCNGSALTIWTSCSCTSPTH
jgi:aryl-alcohol dehydrogenase-like predicted oxidoreductase